MKSDSTQEFILKRNIVNRLVGKNRMFRSLQHWDSPYLIARRNLRPCRSKGNAGFIACVFNGLDACTCVLTDHVLTTLSPGVSVRRSHLPRGGDGVVGRFLWTERFCFFFHDHRCGSLPRVFNDCLDTLRFTVLVMPQRFQQGDSRRDQRLQLGSMCSPQDCEVGDRVLKVTWG
ncbi:MAG: hypothetical protein RLZZ436_1017 [Planctomycetota bacterium]